MRLSGLASATIAVAMAWTGTAQAASLQDAVDKAVSSIPVIGSAKARRQSTEERVRVERGALFPVVNIRGETGLQYSDTPGTRRRASRGNDDGDTTLWRNEARIVVNQLLYDGGTTFNLVDEAQSNLVAATFRVDDAQRTVALQAIASYIDVLRNRGFVGLAEGNVTSHERLLSNVRQLVDSGRASDSDVTQAESRVALAESVLENRKGELRDAETRYFRSVGEAPSDLDPIPAIPNAGDIDVEGQVQQAVRLNPELAVARALIDANQARSDATDGLFLPRLELELTASEGKHLDGVRGRDTDYRALLIMTWNLYRGGADSARAREAAANLTAVKFDEADTLRLIRERVEASFKSFEKNSARLGPLNRRVTENENLIAAYERQFELGQRTLLDLLDVQNELFVSQTDVNDASHQRAFDYFDMLAASGELASLFGIANEQQVTVKMFE
ncbi:MAG: TolC family outer membrane protein [Alphaproteobacteria bacterium]|nr:TolC family outer membrane protein [Alphaproteobacteria bacterium]